MLELKFIAFLLVYSGKVKRGCAISSSTFTSLILVSVETWLSFSQKWAFVNIKRNLFLIFFKEEQHLLQIRLWLLVEGWLGFLWQLLCLRLVFILSFYRRSITLVGGSIWKDYIQWLQMKMLFYKKWFIKMQ